MSKFTWSLYMRYRWFYHAWGQYHPYEPHYRKKMGIKHKFKWLSFYHPTKDFIHERYNHPNAHWRTLDVRDNYKHHYRRFIKVWE